MLSTPQGAGSVGKNSSFGLNMHGIGPNLVIPARVVDRP
jgi:hypothetical protein